MDLQELAGEWGIEEKSLRKLSAIVLGQRVSKAQRLSNWEAAQLTDKQQFYAATDAWVCTRIYDRLLHTQTKENEEMIPQIHLRRGKEESLLRRHPWIFSGAIESVRYDGNEIPEGALVDVYTRSGDFIARGHYQIGSIAVRVLTFEQEPIDTAWWQRMISTALDVRRTLGLTDAPDTTCYRLVHGEGDSCRDSSSIFTTRPP